MAEFPQALSLCGIRIDALTLEGIVELLSHSIETRDRLILLNHNLHSIYLYETDSAFRSAYSLASYVYIDGLPVVWLGQIAGLPITSAHRVTFLDSFEAILSEASRCRWRIFYLGSTRTVNERAMLALRGNFPHLQISGRDGFFEKYGPDNEDIIAQIIEYHTDILFVGMGMPNQEEWLAKNHHRLPVNAIITSGGTLDYMVGATYKPPPWAGPLGLYGVMRLCSDPTRLWRRYLIEPLILTGKLGFRLIRQRLHKLMRSPS